MFDVFQNLFSSENPHHSNDNVMFLPNLLLYMEKVQANPVKSLISKTISQNKSQ